MVRSASIKKTPASKVATIKKTQQKKRLKETNNTVGSGKNDVRSFKRHVRDMRQNVLKKDSTGNHHQDVVIYDKTCINPDMLLKAASYPKALPGEAKKGLLHLHNLFKLRRDFCPALDAVSHAFFDDVVGRLYVYHECVKNKCITAEMVEYILDRSFNMNIGKVNNGTYFLRK